jgi:glycosyltransferase involved in cell wall biosynthesis
MPGLFVKQHAEAVAGIHHVAVLYVHPCAIQKTEIEQTTLNGVLTTVVYYPIISMRFPGEAFFKGLAFAKAYLRGYRQTVRVFGKPHMVHANILTRVGFIALLIKIFHSVPYVITEHWSRYLPSRNSYRGWLRKFITRKVVKSSRGMVTVSDALRQAMRSCGLNHDVFEVIFNSVDTTVFLPAEAVYPRSPKVFSHVSCFDNAAKNIDGIIRAVGELSKTRHDFEFWLIGDGPDKAEMEKLSDSLGLTGNVIFFKGLLEGAALVKAYQQSVFTILFSNYENMPVVVAESFACGLPVIATRVGGLPEIVNKNNGILIEAGDEKAFSLKMSALLDSTCTFSRENIRNFAVQKFGKEVFTSAYHNFYSYIYLLKPKGSKVLP